MGFLSDIFGTDVQAPPPRNIGAETRETLQAQVDLAPQIYAMRAQYDPLYAGLASRTARQSSLDALGLYEDITPRVSSLTARANTAGRTADIGDVRDLGGSAMSALRGYNPAQTRLIDTMTSQAQEELDLGATLDPSLSREVAQATRAGQASRGMGYGTRDLSQEIFGVGSAAQGMRDKRRMFAETVLRDNQAAYGDPFMSILGRSSSAVPTAMSVRGAGDGGAPTFNPFNDYASDLYNTNYNAAYSANAQNAKSNAQLLGGILGAAGQMAGPAIQKWG